MAFQKSLREALQPTDRTPLNAAFIGKLLDQIEGRLGPVEEKKADFEAVEQLVRVVALQRINETLTPAIQQVLDLVSRGFMLARSSTPAEFGNGNILTLVVPEGSERDLFTPSPFTAVTREDNPDDFAICRTISYVAEIGEYVGEVVAAFGQAGPHTDLVISSTAASAYATAQAISRVSADRETVAETREEILLSSAAATAAKNLAEEAADIAVEAAAAAANFDPDAFYTKAEVDDLLTEYYTKAEADSLLNTALASGLIAIWSGAVVSIPGGWQLCDGTNDTPDLRNRFIVGAGSTYSPGDTGGNNSVTPTITVNATTLSVSQIPSHDHTYNQAGGSQGTAVGSGAVATNSSTTTGARGGGQSHTHTATSSAVNTLPPYYALAYIMRLPSS